MCESYDNSQASKKIDHFEISMDPYERRMSQKLVSLNENIIKILIDDFNSV